MKIGDYVKFTLRPDNEEHLRALFPTNRRSTPLRPPTERSMWDGFSTRPRPRSGRPSGGGRVENPSHIVLIAPPLGMASRWITILPAGDPISVFNYARNADAPIHRAFFERMARVDVDRDPPSQPVTVIIGRNDETVPFDGV